MHIRVALGSLKVQNAKTIEKPMVFYRFYKPRAVKPESFRNEGFWKIARHSYRDSVVYGFFMKRHVGTIRCKVFAVSRLLFFYEATCRYNSLQPFCCDHFMVFYLHLKCRLNKFKVDLRSGSIELIREGRSPEARWRSQ